MRKIFEYTRGDRVIWLVVIILSLFSLLTVYSSTGTLAYKVQGGNTLYYLLKHGGLLIFGFFLMYIAHLIRYTFYSKISVIAVIICVPLLLFTLAMGTSLNEASRWITIPIINISFQTSDFAKLALIIYVARLLAKNQDQIDNIKTAFLPIVIPAAIICALILPANFSTAAVLFTTTLFLMFIGRIKIKYILALIFTGAIFFSLFVSISLLSDNKGRVGTWVKRVENFSKGDEADNYQSMQSKIAVATGGLFGKGPGNSTQRNFLPHPYSDFIYAIICEEYGFMGAALILGLYLILFFRALKIVKKSPMAFASLLAIGCSFSLVFQAMINMAVAVNLFPVTGQPLPMLSMGGTSIWFTSLSIGIILSVSRDIYKAEDQQQEAALQEGAPAYA